MSGSNSLSESHLISGDNSGDGGLSDIKNDSRTEGQFDLNLIILDTYLDLNATTVQTEKLESMI